MLGRALEWASITIGALLLGTWRDDLFLVFEIKRYTKIHGGTLDLSFL
jgi:hypothetical protein